MKTWRRCFYPGSIYGTYTHGSGWPSAENGAPQSTCGLGMDDKQPVLEKMLISICQASETLDVLIPAPGAVVFLPTVVHFAVLCTIWLVAGEVWMIQVRQMKVSYWIPIQWRCEQQASYHSSGIAYTTTYTMLTEPQLRIANGYYPENSRVICFSQVKETLKNCKLRQLLDALPFQFQKVERL